MEATDIYSYLRAHANELGSRILESFPPLQSTTDEVPAELSTLLRTPLPAQAIAIGGLAKHLRAARAARIVAECQGRNEREPSGRRNWEPLRDERGMLFRGRKGSGA
jgi:hypothetical protein